MPLAPGTRIGHYEVIAPLGAGGMGEVYRASDTKLGRQVALKVLPPDVARDPDRYARFQREAHALAALNHSNIAAIYGLEDNALVMELVDGETLPTPLPVETAVAYARQIAEALEYAHDRNIIHRDLKPANIMITREGVVKVLDFGLAKVAEPVAAADPANSPTLTMGKTEVGVIMGTASYMSPEQAAGKTVDKRSDIWSFGVVLWEMITGRMLFQGETVSHTLADVLRGPIDLDAIASTPMRALVARCLVREPKDRMRDIGEVRLALMNVREEPSTAAKPSWIPWAVASVAIIAAGAGWWRATRPVEKPVLRLDLNVPTGNIELSARSPVAISPDGSKIVYTRQSRLWLRQLNQADATPIAGGEDGFSPFFSPDSASIGFFANGKLKRTALTGGVPVTLADAPNGRGGTWGEDGTIVFSPYNFETNLLRVPAAGGAATQVAPLDKQKREVTHRWPHFLPGGQTLLFVTHTRFNTFDDASIDAISLATGQRKTVLNGAGFARYMHPGYLLFARGGVVFGVRFDPGRLETVGPEFPIQSEVQSASLTGGAQFDAAANGTFLYARGSDFSGGMTLQWLDAAGNRTPMLDKPAAYRNVSFSPDGNRVAVQIVDKNAADIWAFDWRTKSLTRLTRDYSVVTKYAWHPKGEHVVFRRPEGLMAVRADGGGVENRIEGAASGFAFLLPPPGDVLIDMKQGKQFRLFTGPGNWRIADALPAGEARSTYNPDEDAQISPDGKWVAESLGGVGAFEVHVRGLGAGNGNWQISQGGGTRPVWSKAAKELYYLNPTDGSLMVVSYTVNGESFVAGTPRPASKYKAPPWSNPIRNNFDVHPDGKRIVVIAPAEEDKAAPATQDAYHVVVNLRAEIESKAAAR